MTDDNATHEGPGLTRAASFDERVGDVTTIILSTPFVERMGPEGIARYVEVVQRAHAEARHLPEKELAARLAVDFPAAGIELPPQSYLRTAEDIRLGTAGVAIVTDDGHEIAGPLGQGKSDAEPVVPGPADPEDPERPAYS